MHINSLSSRARANARVEGPAVALGLLAAFARKLRHFTHLVEDLSFKTVTGRLAQVLLAVSREDHGRQDSPRMTQQELAAMVGTAREVVGRALKALEREGALRIERQHIVVLDRSRLEALADPSRR